MAESKTVAVVTGTIGSVLAAAVIAWVGIGPVAPGVTIDGPTITTVEIPVELTGHINGDVRSAYFVDEIGQTLPISGSEGVMDWECLAEGNFKVSLIAEMSDGSKYQATHDIQCV
jgi:hypothetical protein